MSSPKIPALLVSLILCACLLPASAAGSPVAGASRSADAPAGSLAISPPLGSAAPFPISLPGAIDRLPAIAYNILHDEYMVVWHREYGPGGARDVMGRRVSARGAPVGDEFFIASETSAENFQPSIAYDLGNDRYLVVWVRSEVMGSGQQGNIYGRFIPWNGVSSQFTPFVLSSLPGSQWGPKVAHTLYPIQPTPGVPDPSFVVVWWVNPGSTPSYLAARRIVAASGSMEVIHTIVSSNAYLNPDITATPLPLPNRYLVVYEAITGATSSEVRGQYLSVEGGLSGSDFLISDAAAPGYLHELPAVASCGESFAVTYQRNVWVHDVYLRFLYLDGSMSTIRTPGHTTTDESQPDVACGGELDRYLLVWSQAFIYAGGVDAGQGIVSELVYGGAAPSAATQGAYRIVMRPGASPLSRYFPAVASNSPFGSGSYGFLAAAEAQQAGGLANIYGALALTRGAWLPDVRK